MQLYKIEQGLQAIFDELEENGGEVTEELLEKLTISQDNLKSKLENYGIVIKELKAKIDYCKSEEKRIATIRKQREKSVEWLQNAVLTAIMRFGNTDDKGVSRIETDTFKFSTRKSNSIEVDTKRTQDLCSVFGSFVCDANMNGYLYTGEDTDIVGVLDSLNAQYKAKCEEDNVDFVPYTMDDINKCPINISYTTSIVDFFTKHGKCIEEFGESGNLISCIEPEVNKTRLKGNLEGLSFAKEVTNKSLTIK